MIPKKTLKTSYDILEEDEELHIGNEAEGINEKKDPKTKEAEVVVLK